MSFDARPELAALALRRLPEGVAVIDSDGVVLACNPAAARLLGRTEDELVGHPFPLTPLPGDPRRVLSDGEAGGAVRLEGAPVEWDGDPATLVTLREADRARAGEVQSRLEDFLEHAPGVFFVASLDAELLYMSPGVDGILGRSREEILGAEDPLSVVHPDDRDELARLLSDPDRAPYETSFRVVWPDGTVRWLRQRGFPVDDAEGRTHRVVGMVEDITDQREERELLTHTLRLLRRTVSSLQEAVMVVDTTDETLRILSANPAAERIFGLSREDFLGQSARLLHPDREEFERVGREALQALGTEGVYQGESRMVRADGTAFPAELTLAWLDPEEGLEGGLVLVVRDLAEQHRAEAELRASEERFRLIAERIDDVFWISTPDKDAMEYVSPAYEKIWGRPPEELYDDSGRWVDHLVEEDRERVLAALPQQRLGTFEEEYRIRRPDGEVRWIWDRAFPVEDEHGKVVRIIGVAEDITERKRAEERFGVLSREISDVLYVLGPDGEVRFASPSIRHTLGWEPDDFLGRSFLELVLPADGGRVRAQLAEIRSGGETEARAQFRVRTREGEIVHVESLARNLLDHPAVEGIVVTARDVTERLALEEQLLQSQKMEAVGRLAGGIAHDFNNLLTVIRAQTDLLLLDMPPDDPLREEIETVQATGDRAAELTGQLLAFSREQVLRPRVVDLRQVVRNTGSLLERIIGEDIEVVHDLGTEVRPVRVDPTQLEHVILNLAVNARDAMPRGGVLTFTVKEEQLSATKGGRLGLAAGDYVTLQVRDSGVGMDEETRRRAFEPFFTTKAVGEGTGLGLAMAHGVVLQSGGEIHVESAPGEGAVFTLRFPAVAGAVEVGSGEGARAARAATATGTVVLVEDDSDVRRATGRILERAGLTVHPVARAEEALRRLEEGAEVDLVLTDLVLPGMSGHELVERIRRDHPEIPVVAMSGYAAGSPGHRGGLPEDLRFIQKPFTPTELVRTLQDALDGDDGKADEG